MTQTPSQHIRVGALFRRFWLDYAIGIACLVGTNYLAARIPLEVKSILDVLGNTKTGSAWPILGYLGAMVAAMYIIRIVSRYCLIGVGRKIEYDIRLRLYQHVLSMPRSFFDVQQTGDLMSRLTNDLTALRICLGGGVMLLVNVVAAYGMMLPMMASLNGPLTLFAFALYPLAIFLMRGISQRVKGLSHQVQDHLGDLTALAQENFSGMSVIQSYAKEAEESARFKEAAMRYFRSNVKLVRSRAVLYILIAVVSSISLLLVLAYGGQQVVMGALSLSSFAAFMLYLERLAWPTISVGWILSSTQQGLAALERINALFAMQPVITDVQADSAIQTLPKGGLVVKNLCFAYHNPYQTMDLNPPLVLKDISFSLSPGERVALVGPVASGKTTLLHLLVRLYEPQSGEITVGGVPLSHIPLAVLRKYISLMPQNNVLFSSTIQDNLAYGQPQLTQNEIIPTAQTAQLHPEIISWPLAYQTEVGERGITLSGGQRQRSALIRTLLQAPQILLLDDPFSSVDGETEQAIIGALEERGTFKEKITVVATHRFAWVTQADKVILLNEAGQIEAIGTHTDLLATNALYQALNQNTQHEKQVEEVA